VSGHGTIRCRNGRLYCGDFVVERDVVRLSGRRITPQASGAVYCGPLQELLLHKREIASVRHRAPIAGEVVRS
jgi:hypothetical protein